VAVILDTNAVSALLAGDAALGEVLAEEERHHLPVIVIGEYRYGLLGSRFRVHLQGLLGTLARESLVLLVDETTAEMYSQVRDELRRKGRPSSRERHLDRLLGAATSPAGCQPRRPLR